MIGLPEILILLVILVLIFGYKKLPQLGRSAGTNVRIGSEKAKELADRASERAGDHFDPASIGRSAGRGVREARDLRDSFTGATAASASEKAKPAGSAEADAGSASEASEQTSAEQGSPPTEKATGEPPPG